MNRPRRGMDLGQASWWLFGSAWLILIATTPIPAEAGPKVTQTTAYYELVGTSLSQLAAQMASRGPRDPQTGHRVWATTMWHVSWLLTADDVDATCSVAKVQVSVSIRYLYPHWKDEDSADAASVQAWEDFMAGLQTHELGHGQNGIDAAQAIETTLGNTERRSDCGVLGADADERALRIVEEYEALDAQYDIDTDHGRSQGAYLP